MKQKQEKKQKKVRSVSPDGEIQEHPVTALPVTVRPLCWEAFFKCQRHPILRSQLLTSLMAGTVMPTERIPTGSLLDAVLVATAAREILNAEVVSDYDALLTRTEEEWAKPDWTCKVFSSIHGHWANAILKGTRNFDSVEENYIPDMVEWYIQHDVPTYFSRELTEKDVTARAKTRDQEAKNVRLTVGPRKRAKAKKAGRR